MAGGIHPPLSVVESWPAPNFVNPQLRGDVLLYLPIILFSTTALVVCARLWARMVIQRNPGIDDVLIILTMIPTFGLAISIILGSRRYGFNRHVWDLSYIRAINSRKITMAIESCYIVSTSLTKVSILLFYRRMAAGSMSPWFRFAVRAAIASVIAYSIVFQLTLFLGCRPINAFWMQVNFRWLQAHKEDVDYTCVDEGANLLAASAISVAQDFLACGMPLLLFWKLQLPTRQKFALAAIFGVGFFLCITGIIRIVYIQRIFYQTYDVTWATAPAWAWTGVEAHLAIVCASAPALKIFFKQYFNMTAVSANGNTRRHASADPRQDDPSAEKRTTKMSAMSYVETYSIKHPSAACDYDIELGGIAVTHEVDVASSHASSSISALESPKGSFHNLRSPLDQNHSYVYNHEFHSLNPDLNDESASSAKYPSSVRHQ